MSEDTISTEGYRLQNSRRHQGELITRVPVSYLWWMVNEKHSEADVARAELERRGSVRPAIQISNHAIDRASLRCFDLWKEREDRSQGLYAWLHERAVDAFAELKDGDERVEHEGIKWVFTRGAVFPTVRTVMRLTSGRRPAGQRKRCP